MQFKKEDLRLTTYQPDSEIEKCVFTAALKDGNAFRYVPEKMKDQEIGQAAVEKGGYPLKYVPNDLKDYEMCLIAVQQDFLALQFVPDPI